MIKLVDELKIWLEDNPDVSYQELLDLMNSLIENLA